MVANPFNPNVLVGRQVELKQVCAILAADGDLLLAGVPGSGRRRLVRQAAEMVGARVMQIDCLRATHSQKLLALLAEEIGTTFADVWSSEVLQAVFTTQSLLWVSPDGAVQWTDGEAADEWQVFQALLALPQAIAEALQCRVVIVFQNFPHLRTWDRGEVWERYLRQDIQRQSQVSYALIATIAESWIQHSDIQVMCLGPIPAEDVQTWLRAMTTAHGWDLDAAAIALFIDAVQGNMGTAIAVLRRLWLDWIVTPAALSQPPDSTPKLADLSSQRGAIPLISLEQMRHTLLLLVADLALTFEALLLLLPPSQVRVLESLALDPTDTPHSREYTQKHHLSRGGGLQGALASLQQKGLVYGADYGYRIAIPLLALWLKHRLV